MSEQLDEVRTNLPSAVTIPSDSTLSFIVP